MGKVRAKLQEKLDQSLRNVQKLIKGYVKVQERSILKLEAIGGVWDHLDDGAKLGFDLYGWPYGLYGPYGHGQPKTRPFGL